LDQEINIEEYATEADKNREFLETEQSKLT